MLQNAKCSGSYCSQWELTISTWQMHLGAKSLRHNKTAGLAKQHRLPSPFPLTGHLSSGKYKSGLSICWVPQVESISGVSNPARPLLVISSLQSISLITSFALLWTLSRASSWHWTLSFYTIIPSYLKRSWKLQFRPFWKIFSFLK